MYVHLGQVNINFKDQLVLRFKKNQLTFKKDFTFILNWIRREERKKERKRTGIWENYNGIKRGLINKINKIKLKRFYEMI